MKKLLYVMFALLFVVGCADLDYVDDYSDSTFYSDDEYVEVEYVDDEATDEDDKYAQDAADEEVVEIAKTLNQKTETESNKIANTTKPAELPEQKPQNVTQPAPMPQQTPKIKPKSIDTPKIAHDSRPTMIANTQSKSNSNSKKIRGKGLKGLSQSTAKLKNSCENNGNLQKCEDLGRIYATRGDINQAVAYYELACNNGGGSALSCFFLSKIYANSGDEMNAKRYLDMLNGANPKVGSVELRLSTGRVASLKRALKTSCSNGDKGSCDTLQSIFKMRGEKSEMKTFFGTECWKGSVLGCEILRSM